MQDEPHMGAQTTEEAGRERPHRGQAYGGRPCLGSGSLTSRLPPFSLWRGSAGLGPAKNAAPRVARQLAEPSGVRHGNGSRRARHPQDTGVEPLTRSSERSCEGAFAPPFARIGGSGRADQGSEVLIRMRQDMTFQLAAPARQRLGQDG